MGLEIFFVEAASSVTTWDYWSDKIISVLGAILQALIISFITYYLLNKTFQKEKRIGKRLHDYGIEDVKPGQDGTLSKTGQSILFGEDGYPIPKEIDLCFITGYNFFRDYHDRIDRLVSKGCYIKVLIGKPVGTFAALKPGAIENGSEAYEQELAYYRDLLQGKKKPISFLEREYLMLTAHKLAPFANDSFGYEKTLEQLLCPSGDHVYEVINATKELQDINTKYGIKDPATEKRGIEIHYYQDEYQMPIIIGKVDSFKRLNKNYPAATYLWTNINSPIVETKESINVFCKLETNKSDNKNFAIEVQSFFDYLYAMYKD